jgi:predicted alpha/beta superfamily hydrolase
MQCLKKLRGLLAFYCLALFFHPLMVDGQATLHLTVVPPYYTPLIDPMHAAGTMNGWQETGGISQMTPNIDGTYSISFNGTPGQLVEYKYVRGDWARVETQLNGAFLPNRNFVFANGITVTDTVWNWEDQLGLHTAVGNTHILTIAFNMPQLGRTRQIWVYLPQDYYVSSDSFPVLYMQDGQNLFDEVSTAFGTEWAVDEAMVAREDSGYKKLIVVGIDNGGGNRIDEYSPWVHPQYGGGQGDEYMNWLANNLKPFIDSYFRTRSSRENTGLMESSLGGLISFYGGLQYQNVFGKVGIFSPSYWFDDSCYVHARIRGHQAPMRIYHCAGGQESTDMLPDMYAMEDSLLVHGFSPNELRTVAKSDGQHSEWFWAREFPAAVKWLFEDVQLATTPAASFNVQIVPSVADTEFQILSDQKLGARATIRIYGANGAVVQESEVVFGEKINCSRWTAGMYWVRITAGEQVFCRRVVVQ